MGCWGGMYYPVGMQPFLLKCVKKRGSAPN
uniref:Uncharacterized protein n=1 Tax=Anguilla anguilla TaxID=7936 RepID=A0A0E9UA37_ANGAN